MSRNGSSVELKRMFDRSLDPRSFALTWRRVSRSGGLSATMDCS